LSKRASSICAWPGYLLLFLLLVLPNAISILYFKGFLYILVLALVAVRSFARRAWHPRIVGWTFFLVAVSLIAGIHGFILDAPGAWERIRTFAIWPLVYLWIIGGIDNEETFRDIQRTLLVAGAFISISSIYLLLSNLHFVPPLPFTEVLYTQEEIDTGLFSGVVVTDGYTWIGTPGVSNLSFLVPFLMTAMVVPASGRGRWMSRPWVFVVLALDLVLTVLSGRRGAQLVTMMAPFLIVLGSLFYRKDERRLLLRRSASMFAVMLLLLASFVLFASRSIPFTMEGIRERFSSGFDFSASNMTDSARGRAEQYYALMDGWLEHPLIGAGLGAVAPASIRSPTMPWAYELFYLDLLFQTGIFGVLVYTLGVAWIFWSGIRIIRQGGMGAQFMLPILVGLAAMIIASGTNQYLGGFEEFWIFFIPLAFINRWLLLPEETRDAMAS
jgi:O-antigen ligase